MNENNVTGKQRNNPMVDDSAAGTIHNARCALIALQHARNSGSTGENLSVGLHYLWCCIDDALGFAALQSEAEQPAHGSQWNNPMVDISAEGSIDNARKALLAVQCVTSGIDDAIDENLALGLHYLFCCIDHAMETASLQSKVEERKAA